MTAADQGQRHAERPLPGAPDRRRAPGRPRAGRRPRPSPPPAPAARHPGRDRRRGCGRDRGQDADDRGLPSARPDASVPADTPGATPSTPTEAFSRWSPMHTDCSVRRRDFRKLVPASGGAGRRRSKVEAQLASRCRVGRMESRDPRSIEAVASLFARSGWRRRPGWSGGLPRNGSPRRRSAPHPGHNSQSPPGRWLDSHHGRIAPVPTALSRQSSRMSLQTQIHGTGAISSAPTANHGHHYPWVKSPVKSDIDNSDWTS